MSEDSPMFEGPGGTMGFIPEKIDEPNKKHLKDFPANFFVGFAAIPVLGHKDKQGRPVLKTLFEIFEPNLESFEETESEKILHYQCINDTSKTIIAKLNKDTDEWIIEQFEKNNKVRYSSGGNYRSAMFHATVVINP